MSLAAFTIDEQLRGSGHTDDESLAHMNQSFCKAMFAAAQSIVGLKAVGMTGEYWMTR